MLTSAFCTFRKWKGFGSSPFLCIPTGPDGGRERWRPAAKVRKQSGGLAAGRPFSSDFARFVSGELPKCANPRLDWQLAAAAPYGFFETGMNSVAL
jgi:hypothetical protein